MDQICGNGKRDEIGFASVFAVYTSRSIVMEEFCIALKPLSHTRTRGAS